MPDASDWPDLPTDEGGIFVICRTVVGGYWDGADGWVDDWRVAHQFPPAPWGGARRSLAECRRLLGQGVPCVPMYIPIVERRTA